MPQDAVPNNSKPADGAHLTAQEIQTWLIGRVVHALGNPSIQVDADSEFSRLGLDSIVAVRITGELEALLGRPVDSMLVWDYRTVGEAVAYLAKPPEEPTAP